MDWLLGIIILLVLISTTMSVLNFRRLESLKEEMNLVKNDAVKTMDALKNDHEQQINLYYEQSLENLLKQNEQLLLKYSQELKTLNNSTEKNLMNLFAENKQQNEQMYDDLIKNYTTVFQQMVEQHSRIVHDVTKNMMTNMETKLDELSESVRKRIDVYIEQEKGEIEKWLQTAENHRTNHPLAVELLESALNKYPSSKELMEKYQLHIKELIQSNEEQIRKTAIEKYNRAARLFLDNCSRQDWNRAKEIMDEALKLGNQYMKEAEVKLRTNAAFILSFLEEKVALLNPGVKLTQDEMDELERIDNSIDKKYIQQIPELRDRYAKISQKFMQYFSNMENDEEAIRSYNLRAINEIQEAHDKFKGNEKSYKQGIGVNELVTLLGGWDANLLQPSTQIYFQSVYSNIFAKLNPEVKPDFTKKMLQTNKKGIR